MGTASFEVFSRLIRFAPLTTSYGTFAAGSYPDDRISSKLLV